MNEITYKKQMIKEMNQLHAEHGLEKPEKAQKSPVKPRKARSPKRPKARKPQSSKARVLTSKPDPKAQEPSPARNNTNLFIFTTQLTKKALLQNIRFCLHC